MTIEELDLDIKSYNQLKRVGVDTIEQLRTDKERIRLLAPSAYKAAKVRMELMVGSDYERAHALHQRVITSGSLAAQNLFDMANALKEMRDDKLYKEFGYQNFEAYCEDKVGMTHRNASRYISIIENISEKNRTSMSGFGITKLALLASLSEEKQAEVAETVDLESVSVRELKIEINRLKGWNKDLGAAKDRAVAAQTSLEEEINKLKGEKMLVENAKAKLESEIATAADENARLERENKELRERPVEVAVVDNSDSERRLQETIRSLERENIRQNELMDKRYIEDRRKLEADKKAEIDAIRAEYEQKLRDAQAESGDDKDKQEFKVYLVMAHNALTRLAAIAGTHTEPIYAEKVKDLLNKAGKMLEV